MNRLRRVPVIRRGDDYGIHVPPLENVAIIAIRRDSRTRVPHRSFHAVLIPRRTPPRCGLVLLLEPQQVVQMRHAHPAHADVRDRQTMIRPRPSRGTKHSRRQNLKRAERDGRSAKELSTV